ncbi:MAG: hypothetical protein HY067_05210 [Betaproteobacteria bacterium]|nr:hypothetical protein [Betaproteobacteria bacterium]
MESSTVSSLVVELFTSIQLLAGYPAPKVLPEIHAVPHEEIEQRFCAGPCRVRAFYDPAQGVFIDDSLDVKSDIFARSILLHELVHHAQNVSRKFDTIANKCAQNSFKESDAYEIQNRYLASMRDGHHAFPINPFHQCGGGWS